MSISKKLNTYFDNAATSFPKPKAVADKMYEYLTEIGGTYGRSAYERVLHASEVVETVREKMSVKTGISKPENLIFTNNATSALNTILFGLQLHDCHILISPLEHNAVTRPVEELRKTQNVSYDIIPHGTDGLIDIESLSSVIRPNTRLVIINHQSNVNGCIQPVQRIKSQIGSIPLLIDLAQSLGHVDINLDLWNIDFAAFTGHKGLCGPTGTGGFFVRNPSLIKPFLYGGTGSRSESFEMPSLLPDKFEAGTPNVAGIFGLLGALENQPEAMHSEEQFKSLLIKIKHLPFIKCYTANDLQNQGQLFSIIHENIDSGRFSQELFDRFGIETRSGLHCAPLAHRSLGTFPDGTVRIALSPYHSGEDLEYLYQSLRKTETL